MAAHLDRPVAGVGHGQDQHRAPGVDLDLAIGREDFAGDHDGFLHRMGLQRMGLCTVTSLVPSGKVAST
jgi:hypothetical protein